MSGTIFEGKKYKPQLQSRTLIMIMMPKLIGAFSDSDLKRKRLLRRRKRADNYTEAATVASAAAAAATVPAVNEEKLFSVTSTGNGKLR